MASGAEVGNGYVVIRPTMDEGAVSSLESQGSKSGGKFGGAFSVAAGNLMANAVMSFGATVADTFKNAFDNYANYEQLVGGVDTLFKESSAIVQENANNAFRTAGMSANEYMENVTSFSASLLQSLGGDTEKAAAYADRAMVDMSDNANKMGTDMSRITDAYQGFAKDNYTMLDNLKLGYGGTKTEMQRLIKDAAAMTDVQEKLGITVDESSMSFGNVVNAISVMQESMGIAGTTAREGSETISGAINKLSASWQNFLTGIFSDNANIGELTSQLFEGIGDVVKNVTPRIIMLVQNIFTKLPEAIISVIQTLPEAMAPTIVSIFGEQLGGQINDALGGVVGGVSEMFTSLGASLTSVFQSVLAVLQPVMQTIGEIIAAAMPIIQENIAFVVNFITNEVMPTISEVLDIFRPVIEEVTKTIQSNMPLIKKIISGAMNGIKTIIKTVWPIVKTVIVTAVNAISAIIETAWPIISGIVETAMNAIDTVVNDVWPAVTGVIDGAVSSIKGFIDSLKPIANTVSGIFNNVKSFIEDPLGTAQRFIENFVSTITSIFSGLRLELPDIALPHFNVWGGEFPFGIGGQGSLPEFSVDWYAKGGFADSPTLNGYGEKGLELYWPGYSPYFEKYAQGIAEHMPKGTGGVNITIEKMEVRNDSDIRRVADELNTRINRQSLGALA